MRLLAIAALLVAPSIPRWSGACEPTPDNDGPHALDPVFAADTVAPSAVTATSLIERADEGDGGGCGTPKCGGGGTAVYLSVAATDDRTPKDRLGYRLTLAGGQLPSGLSLPTTPVLSSYGELRLRLPSDAGAFAFDLEIRAIDLNGNVGPATVIAVANPA
ncbi:MAG: hypothetical protein H0T42_17585 [Deltaproteobacteria bacterium]|nr:hypothetical protein [Deltaproteobacteria bacterium]